MPSFQISISPSRRAAGRLIGLVRRALQAALVEEQAKTGLTQAEIARRIGVHRSVINRELQGRKDITLGRVGELAWAMGRKPLFDLVSVSTNDGQNIPHLTTNALIADAITRLTVTVESSTSTSQSPVTKSLDSLIRAS